MREIWYIALCVTCEPLLPQPFRDEDERNMWAEVHREATGHQVETTSAVTDA